ncbi:MAG: DUF1849 family protein [Magnetovibrio sp.]|nr:DUF1849 family protein [Magnetovibrio sp.]
MLNPIKVIAPLAAVAGLFTAFVEGAQAANLVSYRAIYDVRLADAKRGSNISAATGQIAYGVKEACDSWLANQSSNMYLQTTNGDVIPQVVSFSSWESRDGKHYRFIGTDDGDEEGDIFGSAKMPQGNGPDNGTGVGEARFSKPQDAIFKLPSGTMFPVQHTKHILKQARDGQTQFQNMVFEGIDVEGAKLLVTFVSPLSERARDLSKQFSAQALNRPGWNFRLAYFDPTSQTGVPMYEIEADYLDNGVPIRWLMDYGDFTIEMSVSKIEILPRPDC